MDPCATSQTHRLSAYSRANQMQTDTLNLNALLNASFSRTHPGGCRLDAVDIVASERGSDLNALNRMKAILRGGQTRPAGNAHRSFSTPAIPADRGKRGEILPQLRPKSDYLPPGVGARIHCLKSSSTAHFFATRHRLRLRS